MMRATAPRPVPTIYDTDKPLTMFGRPWSGRSAATPVLGWAAVQCLGLVLDAFHLGAARIALPAGDITLMIMLCVFGASGVWLVVRHQRAPITYITLAIMGGVLIGAARTIQHWHPSIPVALPVGLAVTAGLAATGWAVGSVPREHTHWATAVYCSAAAGAAGLWGTLIVCGGAWNATVWTTWFVGLLAVSLTWPATRHAQLDHERRVRETRRARIPLPAAPAKPRQATAAEKWQATLQAAGADVTVLGDGPVSTPAGFALHVRFPLDGHFGHDQLAQCGKRLETAVGHVLHREQGKPLRPDSIRIKRAKTAAGQLITTEAYVYVDVEDILRENLVLADTASILRGEQALSVYDAFTVGRYIDGTPITLTFHNIHIMIAGQTRKGKSSFLDVLIYLLSLCFDALIWMYDGKGGATAWEWIKPYVMKETDPATGRPVEWPIFDWVVIDRFGAEAMVGAAGDLARGRPGIRRRIPEADGGGKWKASAAHPAVFVLFDEASQAVGSHTGPAMSSSASGASATALSALMTNLVCLAAGEGLYVVLAAQRGTVDMTGNGTTKSQLTGRMAFPLGGGAQEASEIFQGQPEASRLAAALDVPGSVIVTGFPQCNPHDVQPGKMCHLGEAGVRNQRVRQAAIEHAGINPGLDPESAALIAKWGYDGRWVDDRFTYWMHGKTAPDAGFRRIDPTAPTAPTSSPPATPAPAAPALPGQGRSAVDLLGLRGVPNPFARPTSHQPTPTPTPPAAQSVDDENWAALEAAYAAGLTAEERKTLADLSGQVGQPTTPPTPPAPGGPGGNATPATPAGPPAPAAPPGAYGRFVQIVRDAGTSGISVPTACAKLGDQAPASRVTLYSWRDRAIRDGLIVQPVRSYNGLLYAVEHWQKAA